MNLKILFYQEKVAISKQLKNIGKIWKAKIEKFKASKAPIFFLFS